MYICIYVYIYVHICIYNSLSLYINIYIHIIIIPSQYHFKLYMQYADGAQDLEAERGAEKKRRDMAIKAGGFHGHSRSL